MRNLFFPAVLLGGLLTAQAAEPPGAAPLTPAQHPLTGSWSWTLPGKTCTENLQFRANGGSTSSSGEEVTHSRYEVSPLPSLQGFYRIAETVAESNDKPDCAGDAHAVTGEPVIRFIQFSPKRELLIVCKAESLKQCFGPLRRIAP